MADRWGVNIDDLMELNGFNYNNDYTLEVGAEIKIPPQRSISQPTKGTELKFRMPVDGFGITVPFGNNHLGIDLGYLQEFGPNQPVYAPIPGLVLAAENSGGAGNYVKIRFDDTLNSCSWYAYLKHLSSFSINAGDLVAIGAPIGFMGNTGDSNGPHVHYDLVKKRLGESYDNSNSIDRAASSVDPLLYTYVYPDQIVGDVTAANYPLLYA